MALSILDDRSKKPRDADVAEVLGRAKGRWDELHALMDSQYAPVTDEWTFAGAKYGWSQRLKRKKRTILYLIPCRRHFLVAFVFGEKAVKAARASDLPASVLKAIDAAKKYVEGRGVRIEVRTKKDLAIVEKLAAIKMAS